MDPQSIAHYRITGKLGEGGMGAVYRATDTKLNRQVAIKVLPDAFSQDADRVARFTREAQVLASLNHPNIAAIFGIEERAIVMELVEGPTLAERIQAGPLPLDDVLAIARQIAEALEAAHEKNIIHRDLKPANVKVTAEGTVKVLDFGLAKLADPADGDSAALAPTVVKGQSPTAAGIIMGTAEYMSPEQASGKTVDKRSDIWSFGVVLWEMLTGKRLFAGETMSHTLADVLRAPIDFSALPHQTPRAVRDLLSRCLQRDVRKRLRDIGEARIALDPATAAQEPPATQPIEPPVTSRGRRWVWPAIAAVSVLTAAAAWWPRPQPKPVPNLALTRLTGDPGLTMNPAISPDGRLIAYASDRAGRGDLDIWVQHRGGGDPIRVTQDVRDESLPSFSPDGSQIVYTRPDGLFVVPSLGGESRQLTKGGSRARFSPNGKQIVYDTGGLGNTRGNKIYVVEIGSPETRLVSAELTTCSAPVWSPDGKHILFRGIKTNAPEWWLLTVETGKLVSLGPAPGRAEQWLPGDRILLLQNSSGGSDDHKFIRELRMVEISPSRGKILSAPVRLINGPVLMESPSVASDGTFTIGVGSFRSNLWSLPANSDAVKISGAPVALTQDVGAAAYSSVSADGRRVAFLTDASGIRKVWMLDVDTGKRRMVTPTQLQEARPILSPDGSHVAFLAGQQASVGTSEILVSQLTAGQPGPARKVCESCGLPWGWWWDNRGFLAGHSGGISMVSKDGGSTPFVPDQSGPSLFQSHPSPDGQWMVIMKGGQMHIVHLSDGKPSPQSEWKRLAAGGDLYRWSPDGNTIYFISNRDQFRCIWAQRLQPATKEALGEPIPIYHAHGARISMTSLGDSGAVGLGVARDRIVFAQGERTGNVWLGKLDFAQ